VKKQQEIFQHYLDGFFFFEKFVLLEPKFKKCDYCDYIFQPYNFLKNDTEKVVTFQNIQYKSIKHEIMLQRRFSKIFLFNYQYINEVLGISFNELPGRFYQAEIDPNFSIIANYDIRSELDEFISQRETRPDTYIREQWGFAAVNRNAIAIVASSGHRILTPSFEMQFQTIDARRTCFGNELADIFDAEDREERGQLNGSIHRSEGVSSDE
jgi:hypothetical protein